MYTMRVLVVDDEPRWRDRIGTVLRNFRLEFDTASDGIEALDQIERSEYGLIVLDVMMPRMDGFEVLSRLKHSPRTATIPVVMLCNRSADGMPFHSDDKQLHLLEVKDDLDDPTDLAKQIAAIVRNARDE